MSGAVAQFRQFSRFWPVSLVSLDALIKHLLRSFDYGTARAALLQALEERSTGLGIAEGTWTTVDAAHCRLQSLRKSGFPLK